MVSAAQWAIANARAQRADANRIGVAGTTQAAIWPPVLRYCTGSRDIAILAQALLAPLLDPSMTRMADENQGALAGHLHGGVRAVLSRVACRTLRNASSVCSAA